MNSNPNILYASDFQSVLNYLVNHDRLESRRPDKKMLAAEIGIQPDTFQRHCNGKIGSDADFARDLIQAAAEKYPEFALELIMFFIPKEFQVIHKKDINNKNDEHKLIDLPILIGKILEKIGKAYSDGGISKDEYKSAKRPADELHHILTEIMERMRKDIS